MPRGVAFYCGSGSRVLVNDHPLRRIAFFNPGQPWQWITPAGRNDLALSMLAHHFNDWHLTAERLHQIQTKPEAPIPVTWAYYQPFAEQVISRWKATWEYTTDDIVRWLSAYHEKLRTGH
jgi:hypothetical protein